MAMGGRWLREVCAKVSEEGMEQCWDAYAMHRQMREWKERHCRHTDTDTLTYIDTLMARSEENGYGGFEHDLDYDYDEQLYDSQSNVHGLHHRRHQKRGGKYR